MDFAALLLSSSPWLRHMMTFTVLCYNISAPQEMGTPVSDLECLCKICVAS